ncbi:MAG: HDIG domain-containing protein [Firmicutes bacterium]|nr:HDIG domain-containing protein [Bacillota bacterium]
MERAQALAHLKKHVKNKNLLKHMYAVEAVMRVLARKLGGDEEKWALAGLLHDIDYDQTADKPEEHSLVGAQLLTDLGVDADIAQAVRVHNDIHGLPRQSLLDSALYVSDPLTGLIVAAALIHPDKKLAAINTEFILNRFGEKQFARGANREQIARCKEELGIELEEFVSLAHNAMLSISDQLGL